MADPQGLMLYPGIGQIISGHLTLCHGINPSVAQLSFAPQGEIPDLTGTLSIEYGSLRLDFNNCRLLTQTFQYDGAGYLVSCMIADRRWAWQDHYIGGAYNLRWPDGSLNKNTEKSVAELIEMCLVALAETKIDISQVPTDPRPEVHWDYSNAAQALGDLADLVGCRVVLGLDDVIHVVPAGVGAPLPDGSLEAIGSSYNGPPIPDALTYVAGPSRYQIDVLLEAVGIDLDGNVKPIDQLSYRPVKGWTYDSAWWFSSLIGSPKAQRLALKSIYRWYRIAPAPLGTDGKPLKAAGYDKPILSRLQILPIETEQCETTIDPSEVVIQPGQGPELKPVPKNRRALVWGQFRGPGSDWAPNIPDSTEDAWPAGSVVPLWSYVGKVVGQSAEYIGGYQIDRNEGIVMFDEPVFIYQSGKILGLQLVSNRVYPAKLALRVACTIRDTDTRTPVRYTKTRILGKGLSTRILMHEESNATWWPTTSPGSNTPAETHSTITEPIMPNTPALQDEADYYINAALKEYQVTNPQEATYAAIMPISPDGAIQSVSWSVGLEGATTKASRNTELATVIMPYKEQRLYDKLTGERAELLKAQIGLARDLRYYAARNRQLG
jgi:hypothetical protein